MANKPEEWGDDGFIEVGFNEEEAVVDAHFEGYCVRRWTLIERWLGRSLW